MSALIRLTGAPHVYDPGEAETVVFDPLSGNTHLLTSAGAWVLDRLRSARAPVTLDALLRSRDTDDTDGKDAEALQPVVAELEQLGLVELTLTS